MADLLIKHLKSKSDDHSALRSLYSQWDFDEKLIPKALQTVAALFPHYSRHDESHSKQILINIERILGKNISLLTASDTWLILESAYWHDIGMVVPRNDMDEAFQDPKFKQFLQYFCENKNHELHQIATALKNSDQNTPFFDHANPTDAIIRFRELMAEWFRGQHPGRADLIVRSPMQTIGVNSPRTELIPSRLFRLLGRVCHMHGAPFEAILAEDGLPFREAGLGQEDCHPRFVACLLRMGDLLDMDDNRFCPVMQRISGDDRPNISKAHEDKHSAIRHLRIDQEKIEVSAECDSVEGYIEAFKWFEWLKQEMQNQMANWRDIVPSRELGLLPTLGKISVKVGGNIQLLRDGERPSFGIDIKAAIELLQGHNLYESKFTSIREVLQNSVDATLLRIWLEHGSNTNIDWTTPDSTEITNLFKKYPVEFNISETSEGDGNRNKITNWTISITDLGTGISKTDLEHMLKVGGSKRNMLRQQQIQTMPEWMKPSGAFGIGLQSLFMISDCLTMETKSLITNESLNITMHSPTGPKEGLVILHGKDGNFSSPFGTKTSALIKLDSFARSFNTQHLDSSASARIVENLDPVLHDSFPYEAAQIYDAAVKFSEYSLIPISAKITSGAINHSHLVFNQADADSTNGWHFLTWNAIACRLWYRPAPQIHPARSFETFYRGQEFETKGLSFPNVQIGIDILSGSASKWLKFSRDKAFKSATKEIEKVILGCLEKQVREDIAIVKTKNDAIDDKPKETYSIFLKSMAVRFGGVWEELAGSLGDYWLDLPASEDQKTYRDYFNLPEWSAQTTHKDRMTQSSDSHLKVDGDNSDLLMWIIISEWISITGNTLSIQGTEEIYNIQAYESALQEKIEHGARAEFLIQSEETYSNIFCFKRTHQELWNNAAFATALNRANISTWGNERVFISTKHLSEEYGFLKKLAILDNTPLRARNLFKGCPYNTERVILPFLFLHKKNKLGHSVDTGDLDALCKWVQPKLISTSTLPEIRETYLQLINFIDEKIMHGTIYQNNWDTARGKKRS